MNQEIEITTVSFREVHAELEKESLLLEKSHNMTDFGEKSKFLQSVGFSSSISTRMYKSISDNRLKIIDYNTKYKGIAKLILLPQLQRVCDKYNLFVRPVSFFIGDIPELNIKHIQNFKLRVSDLPDRFLKEIVRFKNMTNSIGFSANADVYDKLKEQWSLTFNRLSTNDEAMVLSAIEVILNVQTDINYKKNGSFTGTLSILEIMQIEKLLLLSVPGFNNVRRDFSISGGNLAVYRKSILQIAAVESLFTDEAFRLTKDRIVLPENMEADARHYVDLDPIVLLETNGENEDSYLIITAWGDEANDELVANHSTN